MATGDNGNGTPYERARFYSREEITQEQADRTAVLREVVAQGPPFPWYHNANYWPGKRQRALDKRLKFLQKFENDAGRPLTKQEAAAAVTHAATVTKYEGYATPINIIGALLLERRGRAAGRFPFNLWGVRNPNLFSIGRFFTAQGKQARALWTTTRLSAYYLCFWLTIPTIFNSYGAVIAAMRIDGDPAMKRCLQDMHKRAQQLQRARQAQRGVVPPQRQGMPPAPSPVPYSQQAPPVPPYQPYQEASQEQERGWDDSPSGVDDQPDRSDAHADSQPAYPPSRVGGSSWDRLRKSAASSPNSASGQAATPSSWEERRRLAQQGQTDSYSFSEEDRQQAAAKDQAQREFDAMLERERQNASRNS
ncbi:hypothetical protein QBC34DRAFT_393758 [Podospora aff. communis PSN243]|uniref:Uncharacterized protein n=1 Tax=Podospora aff. communis PSN243 TaxID=3040156 RepID=A0AAV9H055_9PEZI|nr:hypothetical protein QBC34DRAFT_393758 [Podospora aff. communis PSN243]